MLRLFELFVTVVCAVIASGGFWSFVQNRRNQKDDKTKILIGLAHDRIVDLGLMYIARGWVTQEEYGDLHKYLYKPYTDLGGDGSAHRIMEEVNKLPIRSNDHWDV